MSFVVLCIVSDDSAIVVVGEPAGLKGKAQL